MIRALATEDYQVIAPWYEKRKANPPPLVCLQEGYGWELEGKLVAAIFVYTCNRKEIAFTAWHVTNPELTAYKAHSALVGLERGIEYVLSKLGYRVVVCMAKKSLSKVLLREGWQTNHSEMQQMYKELK